MAGSPGDREPNQGQIRLWEAADWWIAKDLDTGIASQGETREMALENLDDAVALFSGDRGREPTDEELRAVGVDPADNVTGVGEPRGVLK